MISASFPLLRRSLLLLAVLGLAACASRPTPPPAPALSIFPAMIPSAEVGTAYNTQLRVGGARTPLSEVEIVQGELPPGIQLQEPVGNAIPLVGMATETGSYAFTLRVATEATGEQAQEHTQDFRMEVSSKQ